VIAPVRMAVSICICTYKRPQLLRRTLTELAKECNISSIRYSIVVVDNDCNRSAEAVVADFRSRSAIEATYLVEPEQNIALARNKALEFARGDYVALIDDDEFPTRNWLTILQRACDEYGADGVLGPVRPFFDQTPPRWLIRSRLCERPEHATGLMLGWRQTRTGNVLLRREILDGIEHPFRREFGNGGEDQDFFRRMIRKGYRFVWCNEAVVYEVVPPERWKRSYLLKKALLRGQNERLVLTPWSIMRSIVAVPVYALMLPFLLILGQHLFMDYSVRLISHVGKLLAAIGLRLLREKYF
jgi:succinoglycan biosynthesis protein ExoM